MSNTANKETLSFQTEVKQLLDLMIHSLYSNKEIFLRELISNSSDANDKLRYLALKDKKLVKDSSDIDIKVDIDEAAKTITVRDTGIGMNREDIIHHLGTIAKSGTKEFFQKLTGDTQKDSKLIGQFGVGFYSGFIVADKITVNSLKAGDSPDKAVKWESTGTGEYTIEASDKTTCGTDVILHLKADAEEFLNSHRLKNIIRRYSDHIDFPIKMLEEKPEVSEDSTTETNKDTESTAETKDVTPPKYEVVNKATALWGLPKSGIKKEEYNEFYKYISHDFEEPLCYSHNKVEGKQEYTTLLYIPKRAPFDLFQVDKPRGLKLYVQRVFIMDDAEQFIPRYLRFVRGIIDSNDLPLNISREILQSNKLVDSMRASVSKRVLSILEDMAKTDKEKYQTFWKEFGQVLKEGPAEDFSNKERIADLLRFASTHNDSDEQNTSLAEYIERMPESQQHIYYIAADSYHAALNSPHLETFKKNNIEVILLYDRIDEWLMSHFTEYKGKSLKSATRGDLDLNDLNKDKESLEKAQKQAEDAFKDTLAKVKTSLTERVEDVKVTQRLTDSPACIVAQENAMTSQMERLLKAAGQAVPVTKPILELNPEHPLIVRLKATSDDAQFNELAEVLLDQAILAEGGQLEDPATFVKRFNRLLLG